MPTTKKTTKPFLDLIILNGIIPLIFCYYKHIGRPDFESILSLAESIDTEKNQIISKFNTLKKVSNNALQSQALIQLKTQYCEQHKCLNCAIGNSLLGK